jgi:ParB family transcriptional regulator, chromosome partitioning protein
MCCNGERGLQFNDVMGQIVGNGSDLRIRRIEICHLELRYAHIRVHNPEAVLRLATSFQQYSQIIPVLIVPAEHPKYILIDGYLRVAAAMRCGKDTLLAQIWYGKEQEALIHVLAKTGERKWDIFEEAGLIKELHIQHQLSQRQISKQLGKDQSWVSRRIALLDTLPEEIIQSVQRGNISTWAATRVLTPMARANIEHAKALAQSLMKEKISTRKLFIFFHYYKKSNRKTREKMVRKPQLFIKALEAGKQDNLAKQLKDGPEGQWLADVKMIAHIIRRLIKQVPSVIYAGQTNLDKRCLLTAFEQTKDLILSLDEKIRSIDDDIRGQEADGYNSASFGVPDTQNQSPAEHITQCGSSHCQEQNKQHRCQTRPLPTS